MKRAVMMMGIAMLGTAVLSGCGHGHSPTMTSTSSSSSSSSGGMSSSSSGSSSSSSSSSGGTAMMVNTQEVLTIAKAPSETALPFSVDAGYTFTDTSETTQPIAVE
jgi:hypothetical protein